MQQWIKLYVEPAEPPYMAARQWAAAKPSFQRGRMVQEAAGIAKSQRSTAKQE